MAEYEQALADFLEVAIKRSYCSVPGPSMSITYSMT